MTGEDSRSGGPSGGGGEAVQLGLALVLLATAGFVDAVGLLGFGLFPSFMSGDSTQLSVTVAHGMGGRVGVLAGVIVLFTAGAFLGQLVRHGSGRRSPVLAGEAVLLALAVVAARFGFPVAALAAAVLAMGAQTTVLTHAGSATVGATYVTGTLARLGAGLADALAGGSRTRWIAYLALWIALAGGAAGGALCYGRAGLESLWAAAAACAAMAVAAFIAEQRRTIGRSDGKT